jgi:hypothetical protein
VRQFLCTNPREIVLLLDEGSARPSELAPVYRRVFGSLSSCLARRRAAHEPWLTWRELVEVCPSLSVSLQWCHPCCLVPLSLSLYLFSQL